MRSYWIAYLPCLILVEIVKSTIVMFITCWQYNIEQPLWNLVEFNTGISIIIYSIIFFSTASMLCSNNVLSKYCELRNLRIWQAMYHVVQSMCFSIYPKVENQNFKISVSIRIEIYHNLSDRERVLKAWRLLEPLCEVESQWGSLTCRLELIVQLY